MAVIVKCNPPHLSAEGICVVDERIFYGARPQLGETIYVWEAETAGGLGLAMRGRIDQVRIRDGRANVQFQISPGRPTRPLTNEILTPHRANLGSDALAGLARKLYRQAHNKVAPLTPDEVHFLDEFFQYRSPELLSLIN